MAHWGAVEPETTDRPNAVNAAKPVDAVNPVDAVDAIIGQWAQVRPDLRTDAMAVFGRIYRIGQLKPAFVTYLVAENTLDDFVAALLEQKARTIGVLEDEAADHATLVGRPADGHQYDDMEREVSGEDDLTHKH